MRLVYRISRALNVYSNLYLLNRTPVIIYSTGRVGSMALYRSLNAAGVFTFQVHSLNPRELKTNKHPGSWTWAYRHIIRPGRPARIISFVRDPIALMVSDFFPKLRWITGSPKAWRDLPVDELCRLFTGRYFEQKRHLRRLEWFDTEMKPSLGIDVYDYPFPADTGHTRFSRPPYEVLILKTELDDQVKSPAVADFLGLKHFNFFRSNESSAKEYADQYQAFRQNIIVPDALLDIVYSAKYSRHFFSAAQISALRQRWGGEPAQTQAHGPEHPAGA